MSTITRTYQFTDGTTAYGSEVESEISNIVTTWNLHDAGTSSWTNVKASTQFFFASGTVSAPGIAATSETNTGIYHAGSSTIGFAVTGAQRFKIGTTFASMEQSVSGSTLNIVCENSSNTASSQALFSAVVAGGTAGDAMYRASITSGVVFTWGLDNSTSTDDWVLSRSATLGSNIAITVNGSTSAVGIQGTATNDNAPAGYYGEVVRAAVASGSAVSATGTGQWTDITSISLTAGDWQIDAIAKADTNGSTYTVFQIGIGTVTGNDATGITDGDNRATFVGAVDHTLSIPGYRVQPTATTTYYLKFIYTFAAGTPRSFGRISARRMR